MELKDVKKPTLYTTKDVAEFMGLDQQTIMRYIRNGLLEAVDLNKPGSKRPCYRLTAQAVQDYYDRLKARKVVAQKAASFGSGMKKEGS